MDGIPNRLRSAKAYYEKVGPEGFEKAPIGSGPYMVDQYERNAFLRLKANPKYWGGKPAFETVIFKFVPDATSRVAEVESGSSDVTFYIPYEEYDRLRQKPGLDRHDHAGVRHRHDFHQQPRRDVGPQRAAGGIPCDRQRGDRQTAAARIWRTIEHAGGAGISGLRPSIQVAYDPALAARLLGASGYSPQKPVSFTIQTTRGYMPKDYEMIQAIVGMWRKVGIDAKIEVYEIAKHFELRMSHQLAEAAFYNWGNATGDPNSSTGFAMYDKSPHSAWRDRTLSSMMDPLWGEPDEKKRIAGWKMVDARIAQEGLVLLCCNTWNRSSAAKD